MFSPSNVTVVFKKFLKRFTSIDMFLKLLRKRLNLLFVFTFFESRSRSEPAKSESHIRIRIILIRIHKTTRYKKTKNKVKTI